MVLSFRRLFMPPMFPVDIRDADRPGQSSLPLGDRPEFGDLKFPALELHGHSPGTFAILDGSSWRGHVRHSFRFHKGVLVSPSRRRGLGGLGKGTPFSALIEAISKDSTGVEAVCVWASALMRPVIIGTAAAAIPAIASSSFLQS